MSNTIRLSKDVFSAFEEEVNFSMRYTDRTMKNVTNKEVRLLLENPGKEIEIVDPSGKVIGTIATGLGATGLATAAGIALFGGAAAGGAAALGGGGATALFAVKAAPPAAAVPGVGWIIAGALLLVGGGVAAYAAFACRADKKKTEEHFNEKQKQYQEAIRKLAEEIRELKMRYKINRERHNYLVNLLKVLDPEGGYVYA